MNILSRLKARLAPMDGSSGPETKVQQGAETNACLRALYGVWVRHFAVYSRCAPGFFGERERLCSPEVHYTAGTLSVFWAFP
jgi:hypothetical protein